MILDEMMKDKKKPVGRRPIIPTDKQLDGLEEYAGKISLTSLSQKVGMCKDVFVNRLRAGEEYLKSVENGEDVKEPEDKSHIIYRRFKEGIGKTESYIMEKAFTLVEAGDAKMIARYLSTLPNRFKANAVKV